MANIKPNSSIKQLYLACSSNIRMAFSISDYIERGLFIYNVRVRRIRISNWVIVVSGNGLSPVRRQAITQINAILYTFGWVVFFSGRSLLLQIFSCDPIFLHLKNVKSKSTWNWDQCYKIVNRLDCLVLRLFTYFQGRLYRALAAYLQLNVFVICVNYERDCTD